MGLQGSRPGSEKDWTGVRAFVDQSAAESVWAKAGAAASAAGTSGVERTLFLCMALNLHLDTLIHSSAIHPMTQAFRPV
jgi:hypothetical protein